MRRELFALYVHLPYCDVKCSYCDFFSVAHENPGDSFWENYLKTVCKDLEKKSRELSPGHRLGSIFFGGGTPSKAPGWFFRSFIDFTLQLFSGRIYRNIEITAEANPESATYEFCSHVFQAGVNRLSVGIQSRSEDTLNYLGRVYDKEVYQKVFQGVRRAGFANFNADFISGVPGQKLIDLISDLDWALSEGISHCSVYSLTLEPGTLLKEQVERGKKKKLSDRRQALHLSKINDFFIEHNFQRYEISNYALENKASLHNMLIWKFRNYIGCGTAAHSFINTKRSSEVRSIDKYNKGLTGKEEHVDWLTDWAIGSTRLLVPQNLTQIERFLSHDEKESLRKALELYDNQKKVKRQGRLFSWNPEAIRFANEILLDITSPRNNMHQDAYATAL